MLGSGIQGTCIALELARRGHRVDLYDKAATPLTQASLYNEGKIHLGFVYAKDRSRRTLQTMLRGSLHFASLLRRWIPVGPELTEASSEFIYGVLRETMMPVGLIEAHFESVQQQYDTMMSSTALDYLGVTDGVLFERMRPREVAAIFDDRHVIAAYRTRERSVPPWRVAALLREAVEGEARIRFHGNTLIRGVGPRDHKSLVVSFLHGGGHDQAAYEHVVNALWAGRLKIDRTMGVLPARPWLHRFKMAITLILASRIESIPSTTFVLGPFGDIVNFSASRLYLSWYPACMIGSSTAVDPGDPIARLDQAAKDAIVRDSLAALTTLCPSLRELDTGVITDTEIGGGAIFAWGATDIDEPESELHRRYDIGVESYGSYHSVNTGKYCLAPLFAMDTAERIG